jgi:hypothetical protein
MTASAAHSPLAVIEHAWLVVNQHWMLTMEMDFEAIPPRNRLFVDGPLSTT